jgi:hypothetical protein
MESKAKNCSLGAGGAAPGADGSTDYGAYIAGLAVDADLDRRMEAHRRWVEEKAASTRDTSPMRPIIGIRGDMGAGKDTLAAEICRGYPGYSVWKFAAALREAAQAVTGIPAEKLQSPEDKAVDLRLLGRVPAFELLARIGRAIEGVTGHRPEEGAGELMFGVLTGLVYWAPAKAEQVALPMTVGRLLQVLGTECFRNLVGADVWVDALFRRWEAEGRPPIVIADTRFPNEAAAIRRRGGSVVLVRRGAGGRTDGRSAAHASERALDGDRPDAVLENDGTVEDLRRAFEGQWPFLLARACEAQGAPAGEK